jgi:hypothetical protein
MPGELVEPRTTLAIVLGASKWPLSPKLPASEAFTNSAQRFLDYLQTEDGFNLPFDNLLNLFDLEKSPDDIDQAISKFLIERQKQLAEAGTVAKDLIIYYVGHGGFTPGQQEYVLAIRLTRQDREGASSIRISDLARTLKQDAARLRRYLIFDCCFAATVFKEFQSSGPAQAAHLKTLGEFPTKGTALLCAASARDVAVAPRDQRYTMFSGALLEVLQRGSPELDTYITLAQVGDRVKEVIRDTYPDDTVRPEVLSPDQREGDIAAMPLFPNPVLRPRQLEDRLTHLEQTVESILQKLSRWKIQMGEVDFPHKHPEAPKFWDKGLVEEAIKADKENRRTIRVPVVFAHRFTTQPKVIVSLHPIDLGDIITRVLVSAEHVRLDGFDLCFETWLDSMVYGVTVSWIAISE